MKLTKEGNKIILELEEEDAGLLPMEVAVDAWFSGIKMMLENPVLRNKLGNEVESLIPEELKALRPDLRQKWEIH